LLRSKKTGWENAMNRIIALGAALIALGLASPALAQDCGPLVLINSLPLTVQGARMTVPVTMNGQPEKMIFATGGGVSTINQKTVDALKLDTMNARFRQLDYSGHASEKFVAMDFKLGDLENKDLQFLITPDPEAGNDDDSAGILATDILSHYDVELDLSENKLNLFSQKHCDGHVVYWHPAAVAVMPITLEKPRGVTIQGHLKPIPRRDVHVWVDILLDGKPFKAVISTSTARSTIFAKAAYSLGVSPDSPGAVKLAPINGGSGPQPFGYMFKTLTFDTVTVTNPHMAVIPDLIGSKDVNNTINTDSLVHREYDDLGPDITIGMDILKKLRTYIAFGERRLYVTPATTVAAATSN
jgi:hypothetical protein